MKKYKATEKHPYFKTQGIFKETHNGPGFHLYEPSSDIVIVDHIESDDIFVWLEEGWIEETQEPEFTIRDMAEAFWVNNNSKLTFNEWLNKYKKLKS